MVESRSVGYVGNQTAVRVCTCGAAGSQTKGQVPRVVQELVHRTATNRNKGGGGGAVGGAASLVQNGRVEMAGVKLTNRV